MHRYLCVMGALCLVWVAPLAGADYGGGSGTAEAPYQIATADDLMTLGDNPADYDKHFILTADIDLADDLFTQAVIAPDPNAGTEYEGTPFTGSLWGNGYTISHLRIEGTHYLGLFGCLGDGAQITDLAVTDVNIVGTRYVGGLAGENLGTVTGCRIGGSVHASGAYVGGLLGKNSGSVTASYSTASVNTTDAIAGGLIGQNVGRVVDTYSTGPVQGICVVGGLIGCNDITGSIRDSYSTASVLALGSSAGGLVGESYGPVIGCYSAGGVKGSGDGLGGLVGYNDSVIANSYSEASVYGRWATGGLVGCNNNYGSVTNCYSTGSVEAPGGGAGGLVGSNYGAVTNAYSVGAVTGGELTGGLVGYDLEEGGVVAGYWDVTTSGQTASRGGTGLTTDQMREAGSFAGWDWAGEPTDGTAEVWQKPDADHYPLLASFQGYVPPQLEGQGTADAPYGIHDANELGAIYHYSPEACYRLAESIDLTGIAWSAPIASWFAGVFDGQGFTLSHLTLTGGGQTGLFGLLASNGRVTDLELDQADVRGTRRYVGMLAGRNLGRVTSVHCSGTVSGTYYVGGLIGENDSGTVTQCHCTASVTGSDTLGGLIGINSAGSVTASYSTGSVTATGGIVGGIIGLNAGDVSRTYSTGPVRGDAGVGGLIGSNVTSARVTDCYSTGSVDGTNICVGGLIGENYAVLADCYSTGPVTTTSHMAGGLVGHNPSGATDCFWDIDTSGWTTSDGGTGLSTAQMQDLQTYLDADWNFLTETNPDGIWYMSQADSYPFLRIESN